MFRSTKIMLRRYAEALYDGSESVEDIESRLCFEIFGGRDG